MIENKLKQLYNNITAQVISTNGKYLFCGNTFSDIFCFDISDLMNSVDKPRKEPKIYSQNNGVINALQFHNEFLIVGSRGSVYGLKWRANDLSKEKSWEIMLADGKDVNCLHLDKETDEIYAGCDNNVIYKISLEDGKILRKYEGHKDYVHCLTSDDGVLYSASQDGTLKIWDKNQSRHSNEIAPYKDTSLRRVEFGNFLGGCAVSDSWLVCGGGPKLSLWNIRSLSYHSLFGFPGKIHCVDFQDDDIIVGGVHPSVQIYSFHGSLKYNIPTDKSTATYSLASQMEPNKFMSIGGFSNSLSILSDFRYVDFNLQLYKSC